MTMLTASFKGGYCIPSMACHTPAFRDPMTTFVIFINSEKKRGVFNFFICVYNIRVYVLLETILKVEKQDIMSYIIIFPYTH